MVLPLGRSPSLSHSTSLLHFRRSDEHAVDQKLLLKTTRTERCGIVGTRLSKAEGRSRTGEPELTAKSRIRRGLYFGAQHYFHDRWMNGLHSPSIIHPFLHSLNNRRSPAQLVVTWSIYEVVGCGAPHVRPYRPRSSLADTAKGTKMLTALPAGLKPGRTRCRLGYSVVIRRWLRRL